MLERGLALSQPAPQSSQIPQLAEAAAKSIGPALILGALGYYFGWQRTQALYAYFGFDSSLLGFTTQDYVFRSVSALWTLLTGLGLVALVLVLIHWTVTARVRSVKWLRQAGYVLIGLASCALVVSICSLFDILLPHDGLLAPFLLCLAAVSGSYGGFWLLSHTPGAPATFKTREHGAALGLVAAIGILGLFWLTNNWAVADGRGEAQLIEKNLRSRPEVVLLSKSDLDLQGTGATLTVQSPAVTGSYAYRYAGLRLLIESGGRLFLIPDSWQRGNGTAIIVSDNSDVRIEVREH